jgi:hypothetical protein
MNVSIHSCIAVSLLLAFAACESDNANGNNGVTAAAGGTRSSVAGSSAGTSAPTAAGRTGSAGSAAASGTPPKAGSASLPNGGTAAVQPSAGAGATTTAGASATAGAGGGTASTTAGAGGGSAAGAGGSGATDGCDRACLLAVMQGYLDALVAKDPTKIKVSATLKMTENGVVAKLGDGIWKTVSMIVPDRRLDYADPVLQNVGTMVLLNENGSTPVMYLVRLKVVSGEITEIETMTVRQSGAANGFFTPANLKPEPVFLQPIDPAKRMSRADMMALQEEYLDYLEGKKSGSEVPFDAMCKRYENGVATASGLSSFQSQSWSFAVTRRILIIDEEAGITWGMFPFMQSANALVVGEAFKMIDGKFMMIQAIMANIPAKAWD